MPNDEEELVIDGVVQKLSVVGNPANGESWMLFKSDDEDNKKINTEKRKVTPQEFAEFVASQIEGADTADIIDIYDEFGDISSIDQRELASLVADSYDTSTGEVLDVLEDFKLEMSKGTNNKMNENTDNVKSDEEKSTQSSEGGSDDVSDQTQEEEKDLEEEETEKEESSSEESEESVEKDKDGTQEVPEDIQKKLDRLEELEKKQEKTEEELRKERDLRKQKEYEEIAKSEFDAVSKSADELGPLLRSIDENLPEDEAEEVKSLIKTGYEQADEAGLYDEFGSAQKGTTSKSKFEQRVDEVRDEKGVNIHKARSIVMEDPNEPNPERQ